MKHILRKFEPVDVIAFAIITGGLYLVACGINGLVGTMLTAITFFYFGEKNRAIAHAIEKNEL